MTPDLSVLVLTRADDADADMVIGELHRRGVPVVRFDPGTDYPAGLAVSAGFGPRGMTGHIRTPTRVLGLAEVRSVYYRRPSPYALQDDLAGQDARFAASQARFGLGGILAALDCPWVSHPRDLGHAEYKPAGLSVAASAGLEVPRTLITNRAEDARVFAVRHGPVVYKPLRNPGLTAPDGHPLAVWTQDADPGAFDDGISRCPHMFQVRVEKIFDVRTTVVGDLAFSARITSPHLDWRADVSAIRYDVTDTPVQVAAACQRYLERFRLAFGAFDFGVDRTGKWHFYECNPNGQWAFIEQETGLPIAAALAGLLAGKRAAT